MVAGREVLPIAYCNKLRKEISRRNGGDSIGGVSNRDEVDVFSTQSILSLIRQKAPVEAGALKLKRSSGSAAGRPDHPAVRRPAGHPGQVYFAGSAGRDRLDRHPADPACCRRDRFDSDFDHS